MIRACAIGKDGGNTFIFGLSENNVRMLRGGRPIIVDLDEMGGPPGSGVIILHGLTEEAIAQQLRDAGWNLPSLPQPGEPPVQHFAVPTPPEVDHDTTTVKARVVLRTNTVVINFDKPVKTFEMDLHELLEFRRVLDAKLHELEEMRA